MSPFASPAASVHREAVIVAEPENPHRPWQTPTGDPCPRTLRIDGTVDTTGDCLGCGFCLLIAGLVELPLAFAS
jgi:hypothetical protein